MSNARGNAKKKDKRTQHNYHTQIEADDVETKEQWGLFLSDPEESRNLHGFRTRFPSSSHIPMKAWILIGLSLSSAAYTMTGEKSGEDNSNLLNTGAAKNNTQIGDVVDGRINGTLPVSPQPSSPPPHLSPSPNTSPLPNIPAPSGPGPKKEDKHNPTQMPVTIHSQVEPENQEKKPQPSVIKTVQPAQSIPKTVQELETFTARVLSLFDKPSQQGIRDMFSIMKYETLRYADHVTDIVVEKLLPTEILLRTRDYIDESYGGFIFSIEAEILHTLEKEVVENAQSSANTFSEKNNKKWLSRFYKRLNTHYDQTGQEWGQGKLENRGSDMVRFLNHIDYLRLIRSAYNVFVGETAAAQMLREQVESLYAHFDDPSQILINEMHYLFDDEVFKQMDAQRKMLRLHFQNEDDHNAYCAQMEGDYGRFLYSSQQRFLSYLQLNFVKDPYSKDIHLTRDHVANEVHQFRQTLTELKRKWSLEPAAEPSDLMLSELGKDWLAINGKDYIANVRASNPHLAIRKRPKQERIVITEKKETQEEKEKETQVTGQPIDAENEKASPELGSDESNEEIACPILDTSTLWWGLGVTVLVAASAAGVNNALNQCRERNKKESAKNRKAARIVMKKLGKKLSSSQKPTKLSSKNKPVQPVSSVTQVKLVAPPPDLDDVYPRYLSSVKEANVLIALGLSSILPGQYRERGGKERKIVQLQNKIKNKAVHQVKFDELQKQSKEKELQASIQKTLTQEKEKLATILEQEIKLIENAYIQLRKSLIKESVNLNQTPTVPSSTEHQTSTHSSPPSENDERVGNNESVAESALSEEEEEEGKEHEQEKVQEQEKEKEEDKNAKEKKEPEVFCDPRIKSTDFKVHKKEDYRSTFLSSSSAQSTKLFSLRKKQPTTSSDEIKLMHLIERIHTLEERTCTQTIRYSLEQEGEQDNLEIEVGNRMYLYQFMKIAEMLTQLYPSPDLQLVLRFRHLIVHFHEEISQTEMTLFATAWLGHYEQEKQKTHDVIAMCKQALLTTLDESDLIKEKIEKYVPRSKETARPMCGFRLFDHMHYAEQMPRLLKDIVLLTDIYVTKFTKGEQLKTALLKLRESETDVYEVCEFTLVSIYEKLKLLKKDKDIKELRIKIAHQPDEAEIQKIHSFFTEFLPEIIAIFSKHSRLKAKLAEIDLSHHGSIQKFTEKMATPTNTH